MSSRDTLKERSRRERLFQAVLYEIIALVVLTPVYSYALDLPFGNSLATMAMISLAVIVWVYIFNMIFDRAMYARTGLLAHEKTHRLRLLHTALFEVSVTLIAVPVILFMSGKPVWVALLADIGFSCVFAAYTYVFYLVYDRLRPVA
ncbi:MAG: PACE efflux transporter [Parvibaculaceae bacterium]